MTAAVYDELKDILLSPQRPLRDGTIMSFCPVHEADGKQHERSLSLHPEAGVTCWRGCTNGASGFKQVVDALYARAGQQNNGKMNGHKADVPVEPNSVPRFLLQKHPRARFVRAYEYRDPYTEELLAVKARFEWPDITKDKGYDKTFLWRLPDGDYFAGFQGRYKITDMPLYGAERAVSRPEAHVWVVEGEECVHKLQSLGEVAVCGAWGAGQKDFGDALSVLKDRDVFLVPDNDEPGQKLIGDYHYELGRIGVQSLRVLPLPVPPKGDIVDYLNDGGDIKNLTQGVVDEPTIEVVSHDHFVARIPAANGKAYAFDCSQVTYSSRELNCELAVTNVPAGKREVPFVRRVNLLSGSAVDGIARTLSDFFGTGKDANWTSVINTAVSLVSAARKGMTKAKSIDELSTETGVTWLVEGLVPDAAPIVMFGDGESCKTWLAYSLGLAIAYGQEEWNGHRVETVGGVLVVDYETNEKQMRSRFARLISGIAGHDKWEAGLPIYWWDTEAIPLVEQAEAIADYCKKNHIRLVIIDAAADACGGEPEKAVVALQYFNALNRIQSLSGAATLSIAHLTHAAVMNEMQKPTVPFGSRFFKNRARMLWRVEKTEGSSQQAMGVALTNTKFNDGPRPGPFAFNVKFHDPDLTGPVTVTKADYRGDIVRQTGTSGERIREALFYAGHALTANEIAEKTGIQRETVRTELKRGLGRQYVNVTPDDGSREGRWGILARNNE